MLEIKNKELVFVSVVGEFQNILLAVKSSQVISHEKLELVFNTFT